MLAMATTSNLGAFVVMLERALSGTQLQLDSGAWRGKNRTCNGPHDWPVVQERTKALCLLNLRDHADIDSDHSPFVDRFAQAGHDSNRFYCTRPLLPVAS
jgi:hypothetical protein